MKHLIVCFLLLYGSEAPMAQELSGKVVDAKTGKEIPNAKISILGVQMGTYTDSSGFFVFNESIPDHMDLKVFAEFYESKIVHVVKGQNVRIELAASHLELEHVVLVIPAGVMERNNTVKVERLKLNDVDGVVSSNLVEAISNISGVQQSSTGAGISKPVIRGMQGMRVLTVLNGMRIQNQQWGGDHGLGVSQLGLGSVEIIKGPSSLLYGADAFGGILYLSDAPFADIGTYEVVAASQFESVNMGTNSSLMLNASKNNMRFSAGGLISNYADYQMGNGLYLKDSRYRDAGAKLRFGYNKHNWSLQARYLYSNSYISIPGHTHDSIVDYNEFQVTSQNRKASIPAQAIQNHFASVENSFFLGHHKLKILFAHSYNDLSEFEDKVTIPELRMYLNNSMLQAQFSAELSKNWKWISGYQGIYEVNKNDEKVEQELIVNYNQIDNGLFSMAHWNKDDKYAFQFGLRADHRYINTDTIQRSFVSPNFSLGGVIHFGDKDSLHSSLRMNISSGFRVPHVSELLSNGAHHGALRYEIGNPDLKAERATQFDINYEVETEHLSIVVNPFYSFIQNYIQIEQQDSLIDNLPYFQYAQFEKAQLYGLDLGIHYHPHFAHWLHFESSYSYIRGESFNDQNISMIPQARINSIFTVNFKAKSTFRPTQLVLQHQYYFDQDNVTDFETRSSAYNVIHIGMNFRYELSTPINISLGLKNMLNESYANHLSRVRNIQAYEPGRNFYIKAVFNLQSKFKDKQKSKS